MILQKPNLIFCKWLLLENAISYGDRGQSWERVLLKHSCILSTCAIEHMHLFLGKTLSQASPHGEIRHFFHEHLFFIIKVNPNFHSNLNIFFFKFDSYFAKNELFFHIYEGPK